MIESVSTALLRIFLTELSTQAEIYSAGVNELISGIVSKENIATLIATVRAIMGGAKIVHLDAVSLLAKALEGYFNLCLTKSSSDIQGHRETLLKAGAFLKALSLQGAGDLPGFVAQQMKIISELTADVNQLFIKESAVIKGGELANPDESLLELFRIELENQTRILSHGLMDLEQTGVHKDILEALMRAAHSIKGAARVMQLDSIVRLAHVIEDCFVAVQQKQINLDPGRIDLLLKGIDFFNRLAQVTQNQVLPWLANEVNTIQAMIAALTSSFALTEPLPPKGSHEEPQPPIPAEKLSHSSVIQDRVLRVTAQNLNRLMGLAGESLVESRWLQPFAHSLLKLKINLNDVARYLDFLRELLEEKGMNERVEHYFVELQHRASECTQNLTDRMSDLEMFILRHANLSDRLYREVIDSRMRPFADGVEGFPRMVRDLARQLNKKVHFEINGKNTPVDREILEKLEAPLSHLLRNAIDHGIELPEERVKKGKNPEGSVKLEAQHRAGMLAITVSDDGRGLDIEFLRTKIIERNLVARNIALTLTNAELLDFLFLPGFTTTSEVTEISGRGVGLNVVQSMLQEVAGTIRVFSESGKGMVFHLLLPLTLSVIRALIVDIAGEPYAFPLARVDRALYILKSEIEFIENRQYFKYHGQNIGLVTAAQVLDLEETAFQSTTVSIIVLSDHVNSYGIVVDQFLGEKELVVQELDARLGKVPNINSGGLMEDGSPVLIVDIEDIIRSIDTILSGGPLHKLAYSEGVLETKKKKKILVVDDSLTVREVECRLLQNKGYEVQSAVNGVDGWNALRSGKFDLVVTDIDMPRMNGIELLKLMRADQKLKDLPVMIVSYKERDEDRIAGLEAGANYYLTKSSFHDETLVKAVIDLIGEA